MVHCMPQPVIPTRYTPPARVRSEEHTSELQSDVCSSDLTNGGYHHREPEVSFVGTGVSRYGHGASANYTRDLSPQMPSLRRPRSVPSYREPSVETDRMLYRPSATVMAANRIKKRSIHQRLGVRARLSMPRYRAGAGLRSWGSSDSVNSGVGGARR